MTARKWTYVVSYRRRHLSTRNFVLPNLCIPKSGLHAAPWHAWIPHCPRREETRNYLHQDQRERERERGYLGMCVRHLIAFFPIFQEISFHLSVSLWSSPISSCGGWSPRGPQTRTFGFHMGQGARGLLQICKRSGTKAREINFCPPLVASLSWRSAWFTHMLLQWMRGFSYVRFLQRSHYVQTREIPPRFIFLLLTTPITHATSILTTLKTCQLPFKAWQCKKRKRLIKQRLQSSLLTRCRWLLMLNEPHIKRVGGTIQNAAVLTDFTTRDTHFGHARYPSLGVKSGSWSVCKSGWSCSRRWKV